MTNRVQIERQAAALANRAYAVETVLDEATGDGAAIHVASNPELPGCMSTGATQDEAIENLADARREYIASLIEDGLPVPGPATMSRA